jgi:uncharacterized membrane protein SpoIIM required for sporulation
MIVDLGRFVAAERPNWDALERELDRLEQNPGAALTLEQAEQLHRLYRRASSALGRVSTLASEPELRRYLEWLVGRAYAEIYESRARHPQRLASHWWRWFSATFPQTFRRHWRAFQLSVALTLLGVFFGALALGIDPDAKGVIMPFAHLAGKPSERVRKEMADRGKNLDGRMTSFSAELMTHNTRVSLFTMSLGMTFGLGTVVLLFYNGVILGAVAFDYITDGQSVFLAGWLLPHGSIEIPAILLAGQAGLVLAHALLGWGRRDSRRQRLRQVLPDLVTLIAGVGLMLVWAGIIEAFFSQYHEPVLPYGVKIGFGAAELVGLALFLWRGGRGSEPVR